MTVTVTRQQLNDRLDGLRDAMTSLRGCTRSERQNELMILKRVYDEIAAMHLDYPDSNPSIDDRRVRLLEQAQEHLQDYL
jgi:hypothetical protein